MAVYNRWTRHTGLDRWTVNLTEYSCIFYYRTVLFLPPHAHIIINNKAGVKILYNFSKNKSITRNSHFVYIDKNKRSARVYSQCMKIGKS